MQGRAPALQVLPANHPPRVTCARPRDPRKRARVGDPLFLFEPVPLRALSPIDHIVSFRLIRWRLDRHACPKSSVHRLSKARATFATTRSGCVTLAEDLREKGVQARLDLWPGWQHDWPYWKEMIRTYV